jgi:hypothetical protein
MRESFVFYSSFYEAIKELPEATQLELYNALCEYSFNDNLPELSPVAKAIFTVMKPNIDRATARYLASVENGRKGGAPKGNSNARKQPKNNLKQPKNNLNDNVNDNDNDNVDDNVNVDVNVESTTTYNLSPALQKRLKGEM